MSLAVHTGSVSAISSGVTSFAVIGAACLASPSISDSPPCRRGGSPSPLLNSWRIRPASAAGRCAVVGSSRHVTREESIDSSTSRAPSSAALGAATQESAAKIDWLHATFDSCALDVPKDSDKFHVLLRLVGGFLGGSVVASSGKGMHGFKKSWLIETRLDDGSKVVVGAIAFGGESQRGRLLLQLTGKGCGLVKDWPGLQKFLGDVDAKITRVDLAVDFLAGEYCVDDVVALYYDGAFISRGRNPNFDVQGGWHEDGTSGRTA